ncbi:MAG: type II toxin-antitoxin system mRNA interferase toxin, RelE/StbE family [Candidatus Portnoybacteria bacterium]|nr:type II toxin-antitoxin system mRNA interferase toxin, RelE/StbE family [Candidatus Portnoybacteria bacterium]
MNGRKPRSVRYSKKFLRLVKKLPQEIALQVREKEFIFRQDPFDPRLKTHKLHGKQREIWAFWANYSYRITFIFLNEHEVLFLEIGPHDMYA